MDETKCTSLLLRSVRGATGCDRLFVYSFVSRVTQGGFGWNFQGK